MRRVATNGWIALVLCLALMGVMGCRASGPFEIELELLRTGFPPEVSCPGIEETVSGLECTDVGGSCMLARTVESLEVSLEVIEVPAEAVGERLAQLLTDFCRSGTPCPVRRVGEPVVLGCGTTAGACLIRELGTLDAMLAAATAPTQIDVRGAAFFRLVVTDTSGSCTRENLDCTIGCAYTLPLVLGSGPVQTTLALDATGGCTLPTLRVCAGYAGLP